MGIFRTVVGLGLVVALGACSSEAAEPETSDDDLTSLTARQRILTFEGVVYVEAGAKQEAILEAARKQAQSAFGALLNSEVAVQTREVQNVDAGSFKKRSVRVVDAAKEGDAGKEMLEVRYSYSDNAVVPVKMSRKTSLSLALLGQGAEPKTTEIVAACTKNDHEAQEDARDGLLWYDFNPSKGSCREAMTKEQRTIDTESASLADPKKMVPRSRAERVFLPVTMQLARAATATRPTYPEYDRLFAGGADPGALTVVILNGRLAHKKVEAKKDDGYYEWLAALDVLFTEHPDFTMTKIEPDEPITNPIVDGKRYPDLSFKDFIRWTVYGDGWPEGMPASSRDAIVTNIANKLDNHWVTFEKKVKVQIGEGAAKDLTLRIETLFGADEDPAPHRRAVKRGDVVLYNGHSYIGYGPLDPDNFKDSSFSSAYQLLFFDSCVSYNYYEKDFFLLKPGGSKDLDMITNGLEAPEWLSGESQGKFVAKLLDGSMPSYQTLLAQAKATDSLRVVDGEIDNRYDPARTPVRLTKP
jgi:hypothetical protein